MAHAHGTDQPRPGISIKLFVAPVAIGAAASPLLRYLYVAGSAAAARSLSVAVAAAWTWFVFVVLRGDVARTGRRSVGWAILVYFTGVFGLIAWDATRRRLS